jgi:hypothetical protein
MRSIVLTAACALGLGFAALGGVSAAPLASGMTNYSPIEQVQYYGPRHRACRVVTRCFRNAWGRRVCRSERICRW